MISLLPANGDMLEAERAQMYLGEQLVDAFDFLQAENVRLVRLDEALDEIEAQAHGVDIPSGESKAHGEWGMAGGWPFK